MTQLFPRHIPGRRRFAGGLSVVLALAALAVCSRAGAQAPTFNTLLTTYKGGPSYAHPGGAAVGDFNGDGKQDAVLFDGTNTLRVLLGNGNGTFAEHDAIVPDITTTNAVGLSAGFDAFLPHPIDGVVRRIQAVDVNGDGRLDIVCFFVVHIDWTPLWGATVLINGGNDANGVPQFTTATHYFSAAADVRSLTVGDLNGDGKPDFIVGTAYGNLEVYLNNGDGTFTLGNSTTFQPNVGGAVGPGVIADLNGDGKADFVVSDNQAGATDIFWGDGSGTLHAPQVISNTITSVAVADVNGDGKPDLLAVAYGSPNQLLVYLNAGNGSFGAPAAYSTGGASSNGWTSVVPADINGDGKLDAVVTNSGSNTVAVLLGDGTGAFAAPTLFTVNQAPNDTAVVDFNGDGKLDIGTVGANDDTYGVLTNTTLTMAAPVVASASLTQDYGTVFSYTISATNTPTTYGATNLPSGLILNGNMISGTLPNVLGTFTIGLSASNAGGTGTGTLSLIIIDQTPPVIAVPADVTAEATGPNGAVVTFTVTAVDAIDGSVPVAASSASGSTFPLGTTAVGLAASDKSGNTATAAFNVTVRDTTPPTVTASLVNISRGGDDESAQFFKVVFSATDLVGVKSTSANLNGIAVTNGEIVQLQALRAGRPHVEQEDGVLQIRAASFQLNVTGTDTSGNTATATATPVFNKSGHDSESNANGHDS